jgi:hypothetical protein
MLKLKSLLAGILQGRVWPKALAGLACIVGVGSVATAEDIYRPKLGVEVVLPGMYNDNFGASRTDKVDGLNATPAGKLALTGNISEALAYTVVAGVIVDRYDKTGFAGDTARSGVTLSYTAAKWRFDLSYEARWLFTPTFEDLQTRLDNFVFLTTIPTFHFGWAGDLTFQAGYRERVATDVVSSHHSPYATASWEKRLEGIAKDWKLGADLLVRYLEFDRGRAVTAKDLLISKEVSLARALSTNLELKFSAAHETRDSNILERNYENWLVGATLTLSAQIF